MASSVPDILLNNGKTIPQFGFGTWEVAPEDTVEAVTTALEVGYRHIDTAQMYGNEKQVGEAIKKSGLPREELFITSKLNNGNHEPDKAKSSFDQTLADLDLEYIDLFLIHWPLPTQYGGDYVSTWKALEDFYREGRSRSIGVSNFNPHHLRRLHSEAEITPAVDQIEVNPFLTQEDVRAFCAEHQIAVEGWSPLAQGKVIKDPTIATVAKKYDKTPAQVALRWQIELGLIVFPRSVKPERARENFDIWDFEMSGEDVEALSALNKDERTGPDPDTFDYIPS